MTSAERLRRVIEANHLALSDQQKLALEVALDAHALDYSDDAIVARTRLTDLADAIDPVLSYIPPEMRSEVDGTLAAVRQFLAPPNSVQ